MWSCNPNGVQYGLVTYGLVFWNEMMCLISDIHCIQSLGRGENTACCMASPMAKYIECRGTRTSIVALHLLKP